MGTRANGTSLVWIQSPPVEEFTPPVQRRKVDPRAVGADTLNYLTGGLVVPHAEWWDPEKLDHQLLIPDAFSPCQQAARRFDEDAESWRRLHAALLIDALDALAKPHTAKGRKHQDEAIAWFN